MHNGQTNTGSSGPKGECLTSGFGQVHKALGRVGKSTCSELTVGMTLPPAGIDPRVTLGPSASSFLSRNWLNEADLDAAINLLKRAKDAAWPKPLKPLGPASKALLSYLRKHDAITPLKAREELGIEHLPRRIKDLKEHGHQIVVTYERSERGKRYGRYSLFTPSRQAILDQLVAGLVQS